MIKDQAKTVEFHGSGSGNSFVGTVSEVAIRMWRSAEQVKRLIILFPSHQIGAKPSMVIRRPSRTSVAKFESSRAYSIRDICRLSLVGPYSSDTARR
jgi:hypothetical protein